MSKINAFKRREWTIVQIMITILDSIVNIMGEGGERERVV
jgi:hypothetical protein